jgi:hypothetical protein
MQRIVLRTIGIAAGLILAASTTFGNTPRDKKTSHEDHATSSTKPVAISDRIVRGNFNPNSDAKEKLGVRVARIVKREELPGGPWATGDINDYVLQSKEICVVVKGEICESQQDYPLRTGSIMDISFGDEKWDQFGGIDQWIFLDGNPSAIVFDTVSIKDFPKDEVAPCLMLTGHALENPDIEVVSIIRLAPNLPQLIVTTDYMNNSKKAIQASAEDRVNWGALPIFLGGHGIPAVGKPLTMETPWISGILDNFSLSIVNNSAIRLKTETLHNKSSVEYLSGKLEPKKVFEVTRSFLLTRGDMAPVLSYILASKKIDHGTLVGNVLVKEDKSPVENAQVEIRSITTKPDGKPFLPPFAITRTDATGAYKIDLPPGDYSVKTRALGHPTLPVNQVVVKVEPGKETRSDIEQRPYQTIVVEAFDSETSEPIPAKMRLEPAMDWEQLVRFGPDWVATGCGDTYYLKPGPNEVPRLYGEYIATFSRGPEYDIVTKKLGIYFDEIKPVRVSLRRVVPTYGALAVDFCEPTDIGPDSHTTAEDLVLAAAGEGVEVIVSGDINRVTDLQPAVKKLGLEKWISAFKGVHLSCQTPRMFGEFYVFPIRDNYDVSNLDQFVSVDRSPKEFFEAVRKRFPKTCIMVLDPLKKNSSYLSYYQMDMENENPPYAKDFSWDFDGIEAANGPSKLLRADVMRLIYSLSRNEQYVLPFGTSRSGQLNGGEPGSIRTYLRSGFDAPSQMNVGHLKLAFDNSNYFITNGPYVVHKMNGNWPPRMFSPRDGLLQEELEVYAAPWINVKLIASMSDGRQMRQATMRPTDTVKVFPYDEKTAKIYDWPLRTQDPKTGQVDMSDVFVNVVVEGSKIDKVYSKGGQEDNEVFALTPLSWIDGNGDEKYEFK